MSKVKLVSAPRVAVGNVKNGDSLYGDLEEKVEKLIAEGWKIVGPGPERTVVVHGNWIVELLRKIPVVSFFINIIFPIVTMNTISMIVQKD